MTKVGITSVMVSRLLQLFARRSRGTRTVKVGLVMTMDDTQGQEFMRNLVILMSMGMLAMSQSVHTLWPNLVLPSKRHITLLVTGF